MILHLSPLPQLIWLYLNYCLGRKLSPFLPTRELQMWTMSLSLHHQPHSLDFLALHTKKADPLRSANTASSKDTGRRTALFIWKVHIGNLVTLHIVHRRVLNLQPFLQLWMLLPLLNSLHRSSPSLLSTSSRWCYLLALGWPSSAALPAMASFLPWVIKLSRAYLLLVPLVTLPFDASLLTYTYSHSSPRIICTVDSFHLAANKIGIITSGLLSISILGLNLSVIPLSISQLVMMVMWLPFPHLDPLCRIHQLGAGLEWALITCLVLS